VQRRVSSEREGPVGLVVTPPPLPKSAGWIERLGVSVERLLITEQKQRWGSCTGTTIRINWRVMQAPTRLVDYVVAHEVLHRLHEHHGPKVWANLGT
jgi:predicted metal-dependent hydrolase